MCVVYVLVPFTIYFFLAQFSVHFSIILNFHPAEAEADEADQAVGGQVDLQRVDALQDALHRGELGGVQGAHEGGLPRRHRDRPRTLPADARQLQV